VLPDLIDKPVFFLVESLFSRGWLGSGTIIGGVVPVVNVAGVKAGQLVLDGATIAGIYLGEITNWRDPRITKLNPRTTLPDEAIVPFYRSDGSGANDLFTDYLSASSPKFKQAVGVGTSVQWPGAAPSLLGGGQPPFPAE
jgi:phosphate transport system substrate-binding protein